MSAEPGRKAAYSNDLRWRIVWQRIGMELTYRRIAKNLSLSLGTVHNVYRHFKETGEVAPAKADYQDRGVLNSHQQLIVIGLLLENPGLYLGEVCGVVADVTGVHVSASTICRIIHKHGFTRKKIQQVALQRSAEYRGQFIAEVQLHKVEQFIWIDETGCDRRDQARNFGYSLKRERPVYHHLLRGERISAIAALAADGLVAVEFTKGAVCGEKFLDFVRGSLIPLMLPFDGLNPKSVAIMDNCSIHHVQAVADLFTEAGILVLFLPPYSPDLNPAEELFSSV